MPGLTGHELFLVLERGARLSDPRSGVGRKGRVDIVEPMQTLVAEQGRLGAIQDRLGVRQGQLPVVSRATSPRTNRGSLLGARISTPTPAPRASMRREPRSSPSARARSAWTSGGSTRSKSIYGDDRQTSACAERARRSARCWKLRALAVRRDLEREGARAPGLIRRSQVAVDYGLSGTRPRACPCATIWRQ